MELANGKVDDIANKWFIGKPINDVWVYKYDRLWQNSNDDLRQLSNLWSKFYYYASRYG